MFCAVWNINSVRSLFKFSVDAVELLPEKDEIKYVDI